MRRSIRNVRFVRQYIRNVRVTSRNGRFHYALSSVRGVTCRHIRCHLHRVCRQSDVVKRVVRSCQDPRCGVMFQSPYVSDVDP